MGLSLVRRPVKKVSDGWLHLCNLRNDVGCKTSFDECCGVSQDSIDYQSDESLRSVLCVMKRKAFLMRMKQHILLLM